MIAPIARTPLHLRDAPWMSSPAAMRVLALLNSGGEEARVVGGAVRNALLGLPAGDIDIATTAVPDDVMRRAAGAGVRTARISKTWAIVAFCKSPMAIWK